MIGRLLKYRKFRDYFNLKESECVISLVITIALTLFLLFLDFYSAFYTFHESVNNLLLSLIEGFIGLTGIVLSGIAIVTSFFDYKQIKTIESKYKNAIDQILSSFEFLAFNSSGMVFYLGFIYFALQSDKPLVEMCQFIPLLVITIYLVSFNIFYSVSLVGNCVKLFHIKSICNEIENELIEKSLIDIANEVRIDFVITTLLQQYKMSDRQFLTDLLSTIRDTSMDKSEKEKLESYFLRYYSDHDK